MLKYLVIAALVLLLILFIYSRLRPYFKLFGKIAGALRSMTNAPSDFSTPRSKGKVDGKLVKCGVCGTWVPADRAFGNKGLAAYCSRACFEKSSDAKTQRATG